MPVVAAHEIAVKDGTMPIYNGMDCCLTFEIDQARQNLRENNTLIYDFERAMQGPALEMMLRGFRVDISEREKAITTLQTRSRETERIIEFIVRAIKNSYNSKLPNSRTQLLDLFYNRMHLKPITKYADGELKRPMDRSTLEKLEEQSPWAAPLVNSILLFRDLKKSLQVLETEIDADWRWRCAYNIAGTSTGRWSSSKSPFMAFDAEKNAWKQTGNNFQNISEELRRVFIPDSGWKLYGIDKSQSEARDVGWFLGCIFGDWSYLNATESGDLHTSVTKMLYPEWDWTGDLKKDRQIADRRFYRLFTYRDASKRLGHACLTEDHEVLTPTGWVSITEKPPIIMQFSKYGQSSFVKVSNWIDQEWTGDFYEWEGQSLSAKMTSTHRILYTADKRLKSCCVKDLPISNSIRIPNGEGYIGGNANITPEIARIIAAYQSDGHIGSGSLQARFHMKKERKFSRLEDLAMEAGLKYTRYNEEKAAIDVGNVGWSKRAGAYLLDWPIASLNAYLEELPYWDGHFGPTYISLSSIDREHLDWIRTCNRLVGKGGNIQKPRKSGFGSIVYGLQINNRRFASMSSIERKISNETLRVLCPTVSGGYFYIRRKEKISITGNSNYLGQPREISKQTRIPQNLVEEFQKRYFNAFPGIQRMHQWIASQLQRERYLINSFGRRRDFFDRPNDSDTLKGAVAYMFQSATGDCLNLGLYRLWKKMGTRIQILSQLHDAVYFQAPIPANEREEQALLREALNCIQVEQHDPRSGRRMTIPGEIVGGFNWAHRYRLGPDGNVEDWNKKGLVGIKLAI